MVSTTWAAVRTRRLARSSLLSRGTDAVEVARMTCGIHAQVQASAELQLAVRADGLKQQDVKAALWEQRRLLKAWTLRGTLHLHPAEELPLFYAAARAVGPVEAGELREWVDTDGTVHPALTPEQVDEVRAAVLDALDGRSLLREELAAEVERRVGSAARSRLRSGFAFFGGADLCQGPPQGGKITLARPEQWVERWEDVDEHAALRELCRCFVRSYGPTQPLAFREWFATRTFTRNHARALFDSLGDELEEIDVDGHRCFVLAGDAVFPEPESSVRLLPEYDVYIMGFRERTQLVPDAVKAQVAQQSARRRYEGPAGIRFLVVDGLAAGIWQRTKRGRRIELRVTPVRKLTQAERAGVGEEAERIGAFLGLEPVLTVE